MSISVQPLAELSPKTISALQFALTHYYSQQRDSYYEIADQSASRYSPELLPFHCHLVGCVKPGMTLLELGCGSAHLCGFVQARGGTYTGMDYNEELLEGNRRKFPTAQFFKIGTDLPGTFDIVASLYTIEHVVDPPAYLENMWNFCRPGGMIAIICPEFINGKNFRELLPSFYYGKTPRRFRDKIRSLSFFDAFLHLLDLFWLAPKWKKRALSADPGAFWINLRPRILAGAPYSIDADAVHLTRLKDLVWWLEHHNATILKTSEQFPEADPLILRYNCYVLARKPTD